jgi:membrane protein required for colicin V production
MMEQLSAIHLTTLDYFAFGILVISAAVGVWRGLFREVIALASWFIAAWLSYHYCDYLASEWLSAFIPNSTARLASAFLLIFVIVLISLGLLARALQKVLSSAGLTLVDRFFGLVFGFARGIVVLVVLATLGALTGAQQTQAWQAAAIRPTLEKGTGLIRSWLPESWAKQLNAISMTDSTRSPGS